jgi:hypothetical protein
MPVMIVCQFKGKARGGLGSEFQLLDDILEFTLRSFSRAPYSRYILKSQFSSAR